MYNNNYLGLASSFFRVYLHWYPCEEKDEKGVEIIEYDLLSNECLTLLEKNKIPAEEAVKEEFLEFVNDYNFIKDLIKQESLLTDEGFVEVIGLVTIKWTSSCYPDSYGEVDSDVDIKTFSYNVFSEEKYEEIFGY